MSWTVQLIFTVLTILGLLVAPIDLIWGWISWTRSRGASAPSVSSRLALAGFIAATLSALLAIGTLIYAQHIRGFGFYDPLHLRLIRWGSLLSLAGIFLAIAGAWRRSKLRWHAVVASIETLAYWMIVAEGE